MIFSPLGGVCGRRNIDVFFLFGSVGGWGHIGAGGWRKTSGYSCSCVPVCLTGALPEGEPRGRDRGELGFFLPEETNILATKGCISNEETGRMGSLRSARRWGAGLGP